jgi:hypothetical protein
VHEAFLRLTLSFSGTKMLTLTIDSYLRVLVEWLGTPVDSSSGVYFYLLIIRSPSYEGSLPKTFLAPIGTT